MERPSVEPRAFDMSFTSFYRRLNNLCGSRYPSTQPLLTSVEFDRLFSPHILTLPVAVADRAEKAIKAHYKLISDTSYQKHCLQENSWLGSLPARPDSVLTGYDFHTTPTGEAYLVEVNTNSSSFMLTYLLNEAHDLPLSWKGTSALESLWETFITESQLESGSSVAAAIVDEQITQQKMYLEFLIYKDWMNSRGWQTDLADAESLQYAGGMLRDMHGRKIDFVYNRLTDFYLSDPRWTALKKAYLERAVSLSPHPWAYLLGADKLRLAELSQPDFLESYLKSDQSLSDLKSVLIPTHELRSLGSPEEVWAKRKSLFFKPRQSHGSKSVYRGSSVSKKVFERLLEEDIVVQEYVPAQAWPLSPEMQHMENWKFDLRFFVYKDQIQLAVARSYQGQVTNFSSPYGGLTAVIFE